MSDQKYDDNNWTVKRLVSAVIDECNKSKQKQLRIIINDYDKSVCFASKEFTFAENIQSSQHKLIGDVILTLSKLNRFDRIIQVPVIEYCKCNDAPQLTWMNSLLGNEFTSLISFDGFDCPNGDGTSCYCVGIQYISDYNVICDMISRDKIISIQLGINCYDIYGDAFDKDLNEWKVDKSKLINAIKSTNTLKEISVSAYTFYGNDTAKLKTSEMLESVLKEALSINFSVTTLICKGNRGTVIDMNAVYNKSSESGIPEELHSKYHEWWPMVKKRNEESQMFNSILVGDQKDDGTWNNNICPQKIANNILQRQLPSIHKLSLLDKKGDMCYCVKCHVKRGDKNAYKRGQPPKRYAIPVEWCRFGLKTNNEICIKNKVWKNWHVAFHGTTEQTVGKIFESDLILLKPGDITSNGNKLGIRKGHI
eukprot:525164_1